eukprot:1098366-Pelagomonas_calceolata.AAC.2
MKEKKRKEKKRKGKRTAYRTLKAFSMIAKASSLNSAHSSCLPPVCSSIRHVLRRQNQRAEKAQTKEFVGKHKWGCSMGMQ